MDTSGISRLRTRLVTWLPLGVLLVAAACQSMPDANQVTNPPSAPGGGSTGAVFSAQATIGDLGNTLDSGPVRVRIRLVADSLVASRIVVQRSRQLTSDERIVARVTAVVTGPLADTLTLAIGGLKVVLDTTTQLRGEHLWGEEGEGEHHGHDRRGHHHVANLAEFATRLQAALAAGRQPFVEARRPAPASPQAPTDSAFVARTIRFGDGDDGTLIAMNVDSANFSTNATPPPDGWITVLGRAIEIRSTTTIRTDLPRATGSLEFADTVATVDTAAHTVTLVDGTVLRFILGSEIEHGGGAGDPASLADLAAALAASKTVVAQGRGVLETATPPEFIVIEVEFHLTP
jgi:hypothetical protein